jgi:hypothetical protein
MTKFNLHSRKAQLFITALLVQFQHQMVAIKSWLGILNNEDLLRPTNQQDHLLADVEKRIVNTKSYSTLFKESL